jgi:hypothetical protein
LQFLNRWSSAIRSALLQSFESGAALSEWLRESRSGCRWIQPDVVASFDVELHG